MLATPSSSPKKTSLAYGDLITACRIGDAKRVAEIVEDPQLDVNGEWDKLGYSPLQLACKNGHTEVVQLLLRVPHLKVNKKSLGTPLHLACENGYLEIVRLLLADPRVDVNKMAGSMTPLGIACKNGHAEVVRLLLADKRVVINNIRPMPTVYGACYDRQLEIVRLLLRDPRVDTNGRWKDKTAMQLCMERLAEDPPSDHSSRFSINKNVPLIAMHLFLHALRRGEVPVGDNVGKILEPYTAGELFATIVLLCDDYLRKPCAKPDQTASPAERFFNIAERLPVELQMILCQKAYRFPGDLICWKTREKGFQILAARLQENQTVNQHSR